MSNQQPPARPWFRLASMVRPGALAPAPTPAPTRAPAPAPTPPPAPEAAQVQPPPGPRPTFVRPPPAQTIRSPVAQPQEPAPPAVSAPLPPTAATAPPRPTAVGPVPEPRPPVAQPPPASTTSSVPTTPVIRTFTTSSSLPTSPAPAPPRASPQPQPPATIVGGPPPSSSSVPSSPKPRLPVSASPVLKPPSPKPASPSPPAPPPSPAPSTTAIARAATPTASPKIVKPHMKTPTPSPKTKPISHPPSPLTLPPAQIKSDSDNETKIPTVTEKKTVLVQETNEKPKVMGALSNGDQQRYAGATNSHSSFVPNEKREVKKDKTLSKKSSSSGEFGVRVITIAGENKGAVMELSPSRKKYGYGNNPQRGWGIGEKSGTDGSGNEEEKPSLDDKNLKTMANSSIPPLAAFMNSNVQEVNNSILYNCSTNHHDPGIHLSLSRKPNGVHGINHAKNHTNGKRI